jgi:hypothetical protein
LTTGIRFSSLDENKTRTYRGRQGGNCSRIGRPAGYIAGGFFTSALYSSAERLPL